MTRRVGGLPPPNIIRNSESENREQRFKSTNDALNTLAQDVISLSSDSDLWLPRRDRRRRVFQNLLSRYYRQIRHGCENPNCETPTCMSCRKRVAISPFRPFTALSARTLSAFLAGQDDPERGLCPNMDAIKNVRGSNTKMLHNVLKEDSVYRKHGEHLGNGFGVPHTPEMHRVDNQVLAENDPQDTSGGSGMATQAAKKTQRMELDSSKNPNAAQLKDPKSFTQMLFDTLAMKLLHLMKYRNGRYPWDPMTGEDDQTTTNETNSRFSNTPNHDANPSTSHQNEASHAKSPAKSRNRTGSSGDMAKHHILEESLKDISTGTLNRPPTVPIANLRSITSETSTTNLNRRRLSSSRQMARSRRYSKGDVPIHANGDLCHRLRETESTMTPSDRHQVSLNIAGNGELNVTNENRFVTTNSQVDIDDSEASPISQNDAGQTMRFRLLPALKGNTLDCLHPSASLSRLTPKNIEALVTLLSAIDGPTVQKKDLFRDLGWTNPTIFYSALTAGHNNDLRAIHAFTIQSITYVLTTPEALLSSFKLPIDCERNEDPQGFQIYMDHAEMTSAFRRLGQIDYHPRNILPSLWVVLESTFVLVRHISKSPGLKRSGFSESGELSNASILPKHIQATVKPCSIDDESAAHIFNIVLAALVATIPYGTAGMWKEVARLRSLGHVAPETSISGGLKPTQCLLKVMDAFGDEMALALMTRLIKAFASRRCWVNTLRTRDEDNPKPATNGHGDSKFADLIIRYLRASAPRDDINVSRRVNPLGHIFDCDSRSRLEAGYEYSFSAIVLEWARSVLLEEWDGRGDVSEWGVVGGALDFMSCIYQQYFELGLAPEDFHTPFLSERLDVMEMPLEWMSAQPNRKTKHILSYSFLFAPSALVTYFRAINHAAMFKAFESSMTTARLCVQMAPIAGRTETGLFERLKTAMTSYLVLDIRRDDVLTDALDQLWRREQRELMRPLKVRMGMDEGEEGVDHGGVQQEFFRIAVSEALKFEYGMFTTDPRTQMSWFTPCALEPLYKFELLGLLTSLAVYNGLTLPVNFPLALYRKLLDLPVESLTHIRDGWEDLSAGLDQLLSWTDGDVEEVFVRSYVFSTEAPGTTLFVDMESINREDSWPPPFSKRGKDKSKAVSLSPTRGKPCPARPNDPEVELRQPSTDQGNNDMSTKSSNIPCIGPKYAAPARHELGESADLSSNTPSSSRLSHTDFVTSDARMVTNANRVQYVADYIFWLTDKSIRPQYEAFARGFFVCLDRKALSIFTPEALQAVVEGFQEIDIDLLEQTTRYENGYTADHRLIKAFWQVVREFSIAEVRNLLEFVTASGRIPVNGIQSIQFLIQRNGTEDIRLPTSLTCFGRLLLPEYSSKEILKEKLRLAIENSQGFGVP